MFWLWGPLVIGLATWFYLFVQKKFTYWSSRGIPGPPPRFPIGNVFHRINVDFQIYDQEMVRKYGKIYGTYLLWQPAITIAEPELVKQVLIKDFHHFINRINPKAYHELWNKNLFTATGDDWKRGRTITSPTFSSGKLRHMSAIMQKCISNLEEHFNRISDEAGSGIIETKATMAGLTIDVIASTAFAVSDLNAHTDKENPFVVHGRKLFEVNPIRAISCFILPTWLLRLLGIQTVFEKNAFDFFINLTKTMVELRLSGKSERRPDLLQMLIDASVDEKELDSDNFEKMTVTEGKDENQNTLQSQSTITKRSLTNAEIIGNSILFFVAGYETTASALSHALFSLAKNPDIQERLYQELEQTLDQFTEDDQLTSEEYFNVVMTKIPYLEAIIKETLRRYTPLSVIMRVCNAGHYQLGSIELAKGSLVTIPVVAIHMDPDNWPEPKRFDPERFMPENRHNIVPNSYLPFSDGPRNCIAMRFAYQEIKLCLAAIVRKFRFSPTAETPEELTFKPNSALLIANEFKIKVERR